MTTATGNRQIVLRTRAGGIPQADDFELRTGPLPAPGPGQMLVRNRFVAAEPAMRGWINDESNYWPPVAIGETMRSFAVGEIVESRADGFAQGDRVTGLFGWQDYAVVEPAAIDRRLAPDEPGPAALGILGLNGLTAYFGMLDICRPAPGETVLVSSAAGAVGSAAAQIAALQGARVVGIAGGAAKCARCVEEFGCAAAIDYKTEDVGEALGRLCPDGVDVYFDNVSGAISNTALRHLRPFARIAVCGTAAITDWADWPQGPRVERHLLVKRATMRGFLATDYAPRFAEALAALRGWVADGRLRYREQILDGLERAPGSIAMLYRGENDGKLVIRL